MWSSPTSECHRRGPTRAFGPPPRCARAIPISASSCSVNTCRPPTRCRCLSQGSERRGYLLKDRVADVDDLVDAIRVVAAGGAVIDPKVVEQLVASSSRRAQGPLDFLTPREREVLGEMAQGKSNAAVAATLVLSERAVEKHINSIFSKLHLSEERDVNRRVAAVLMFLTEGDTGHTSG